jgi:hypothetical protein
MNVPPVASQNEITQGGIVQSPCRLAMNNGNGIRRSVDYGVIEARKAG